MTPYNNVYKETQTMEFNSKLMELQKPYILDMGEEKIIVEPTWTKNTTTIDSKYYKPNDYRNTNKYYRYENGELHEIEKAKK